MKRLSHALLLLLFCIIGCDFFEEEIVDVYSTGNLINQWELIKYEQGFAESLQWEKGDNTATWTFASNGILTVEINPLMSFFPLQSEGTYTFEVQDDSLFIGEKGYYHIIQNDTLIIYDKVEVDGPKATFVKE
ncbi:hypothetical protein [Algivirga pacifica]|uniref:Lipocalin-like domain-containing protein n=1 Tax=Algivirga pacifica TaxID=1162670 RepID=A0ABP9D4T5_9BACT